MSSDTLRIISLTAENVKRLTAVHIAPDGNAVVIGGENESGKSSVLDSIAYALGGEKLVPTKPVRTGQKKAKVQVDLGDYIVTRTFTEAGGGTLTVTNRDGAKYPTPQALLDGLVGSLAFDPLAFAAAKPAEQASILRAIANLDTSDIDERRKAAYDERTLVARDLKGTEGALRELPPPVDAPPLESDAALVAQLDAADGLARAAAEATRAASVATTQRDGAQARMARAEAAVEDARLKLEQAEAEVEAASMALAMAEDTCRERDQRATEAQATVPDRAALRMALSALHARNAAASEARHAADHRAELVAKRDALKARVEALVETLTACDAEKAERLAGAHFPIEGLSIDGDAVTWNGLPLAQASTAIRTRVSVAIGLALNASKRVKLALIRNGNDLDAKNLAAIAAQVDEAGGQCWIERIAGGNGIQTVVIENGAVQS